MMKNYKYIGLGLLFVGLLSGCDDSKESKTTDENVQQEVKIDKTASADNFKKVLNGYYSRHCMGIRLRSKLPTHKMTSATIVNTHTLNSPYASTLSQQKTKKYS